MKGTAALVLSVVDSRTEIVHLVLVEMAALHRRSGRYPALCDMEVISASMMTEPIAECQDCRTRAQAGTGATASESVPDRAVRACHGPAVQILAGAAGARARTTVRAG